MAALPSEAKTFYASDGTSPFFSPTPQCFDLQSSFARLAWSTEGYWTGQDFDASLRLHLIKQLIAPASIDLKVGAQVMLICNLPDIGLFNGSVGIVEGFKGGYPQVAFTRSDGKRIEHLAIPHQFTVESYGGKQVGWRKAVPLIRESPSARASSLSPLTKLDLFSAVAWALSIHKSQGQSTSSTSPDFVSRSAHNSFSSRDSSPPTC